MKLSKAERKKLKNDQSKPTETAIVEERNLGYDADYYIDQDNNEIECVRIDFIHKPDWYYDMFREGYIHYRNNELQAKCSDGAWHKEKDIRCCLGKLGDGTIWLLSDKTLKDNWKLIATSSSLPLSS